MEALSKAKAKWIRTLHERKGREAEACFLVEGRKMVAEAMGSGWVLRMIVGTDAVLSEALSALTGSVKADVFVAKEAEFAQISTLASPEGILAVLEIPLAPAYARTETLQDAPEGPAFFLDTVQDPGNLGTLIRIADWFGFGTIVCREGTADCFNPKVLRASMGSIFRVNMWYVKGFEDAVARLSGQMSVADMAGAAPQGREFAERPYLLLGNEANGISPALRGLPGLHTVSIPRFGGAESLNVAVSAGILAAAWRAGN